MPRQLTNITVLLIVLSLAILAGCGGEEEPVPTPTPLATFTPTAAPTSEPTATEPTATEAAATEPTATDTPASTATPKTTATEEATEEATVALQVTATLAATATVAGVLPTQPDIAATITGEPEAGATNGDGFDSPLAAPDSPLAPPPLIAAEATPAPLKPVKGSWQLKTIKPSSSAAVTDAPAGYRIAFGATGVVRVMGDCKTGRGTYSAAADGALQIDVTYSDVRCAPDSLADPFARALNEVTAYRFEGDRLVLAYGAQGGEMGLDRTAQMAAFGAPFLSWSNLQNSTFLVPGAPGGNDQAPLVDGEFRAPLAANSEAPPTEGETTGAETTGAETAGAETEATPTPPASEFVVSLSTMHTYGVLVTPSPEEIAANPEITAEVSTDTVAVLVVENGAEAAAPQSYLAPVLNGGGLALPLSLELLGESVFVHDLRWDGTLLTVDFDQDGAPMRHTYRFEDSRFVLDGEEQLAPRPVKARLDLPAQAVTLGAGEQAGSAVATMTGAIAAGEIHPYRLPLEAGQTISVTIDSPFNNVWLSIFGRDDQTVLRSIRSDTVQWAGSAPASQEYLISAVAAGSASPYTLTITATGVPTTVVPAATPATPAGTKVVHLVIDGAAAAAPAVLDVLQQNNAGVDFFVDAVEAEQGGGALAGELAGRHGIGLIAGPLTALTSDGRDALFAEVNAARQAFGEQPVHCLRLPPAASDAYTRAAAAEQGYTILQWDIDADAAAAETVAGQVFPNAVVRLDGASEDDLSATLAALLPVLAQQGYSVQPLCQ